VGSAGFVVGVGSDGAGSALAVDAASPDEPDDASPLTADATSPDEADDASPLTADATSPDEPDDASPLTADATSPYEPDDASVFVDVASPVGAGVGSTVGPGFGTGSEVGGAPAVGSVGVDASPETSVVGDGSVTSDVDPIASGTALIAKANAHSSVSIAVRSTRATPELAEWERGIASGLACLEQPDPAWPIPTNRADPPIVLICRGSSQHLEGGKRNLSVQKQADIRFITGLLIDGSVVRAVKRAAPSRSG
jgi:hypothetical protein